MSCELAVHFPSASLMSWSEMPCPLRLDRVQKDMNALQELSKRLPFCLIPLLTDYRSLELNNWKSQLPSQLKITPANRANSTPQRLILHLGYWWCFIVLHQPFISRRAQPIQHPDREVDHVKVHTINCVH